MAAWLKSHSAQTCMHTWETGKGQDCWVLLLCLPSSQSPIVQAWPHPFYFVAWYTTFCLPVWPYLVTGCSCSFLASALFCPFLPFTFCALPPFVTHTLIILPYVICLLVDLVGTFPAPACQHKSTTLPLPLPGFSCASLVGWDSKQTWICLSSCACCAVWHHIIIYLFLCCAVFFKRWYAYIARHLAQNGGGVRLGQDSLVVACRLDRVHAAARVIFCDMA